jgi:hypothetical protein
MSLRDAVRRLAGVVGGVGLVAVAAAEDIPAPRPLKPASVTPPAIIPPADAPPATADPAVIRVEASSTVNGAEAFPKMLAESRAAYARLKDYTCTLVRQERVGGRQLPEQTGVLQVRTQPFSVNLRLTDPKPVAGWEVSYRSAQSTAKVRFRPGGLDGVKLGFRTLPADDPKVTAATRHPVPDVGLLAVLDRMEKVVATERRLNHPVQVLVSEFKFADRLVTRYEVFCDKPHPSRYAHRAMLYVDKETRLPARFEAYDAPKPGSAEGELIEVVSFVGVKTNVGLGESTFDR